MSKLSFGDDDQHWGTQQEDWGTAAQIADLSPETIWNILLDVEFPPPNSELFHVWTGDEDLLLDGETYIGVTTAPLTVSGMPSSDNKEDKRMQITVRGIDDTVRPLLLERHGVIDVQVRYIYSEDGGTTWHLIPRSIRGYVSNPVLDYDTYSFELATDISDVDRGDPLRWSHEQQQHRHPGDLGFEHLEVLADGADIPWPPLT